MNGLAAFVLLAVVGLGGGAGEVEAAEERLRVLSRGTRLEVTIGHLVLDAPRSHEAELRRLARDAAAVLPSLESELGVKARAPYRILLIPPRHLRSPAEARFDEVAPSWASGYLRPTQRRGGIRLDQVERYPYGSVLTVLLHEASHMLLYDAAGGRLPRWFEEGVATWQGRRFGLRDRWVMTSSLMLRRLPALAELGEAFRGSDVGVRGAYAVSLDFVSWSLRQYGAEYIPRLLDLSRDRPFEAAWLEATGTTLEASEATWRRSRLFVFRWLPWLTGSGTLWLAITFLAVLAGVRRRKRSRATLAAWEDEEERPPPAPDASPWVH